MPFYLFIGAKADGLVSQSLFRTGGIEIGSQEVQENGAIGEDGTGLAAGNVQSIIISGLCLEAASIGKAGVVIIAHALIV